MGVQRCLIAALLLGVAVRVFAGPPWAPDSFPNPKIDTEKCGRGGKKSNICDPDHVLTAQGADRVEGILIEIYEGADPYVRAPCGATGLQGYQVAVALMQSMAVPPGESAAAQAAVFATHIHNSWGVGDGACNNGVLLLLAIEERQVYISTGSGAAEALSDAKIASIIDAMRPLLRKQAYDEALEQAVVDIGLGLAGREAEGEGAVDWFALSFFGVVALLIFNSCRRSWLRRREYRDCKRVLAKLKREQDQVRNHAWSAPASCPICLEDFNPPPAPRKAPREGPPSAAATAGEAGPSGSGSGSAAPEESPSAPLLPGGSSGGGGGGSGSGSGGPLAGEAGLDRLSVYCRAADEGEASGSVAGVRRRSVGRGLNEDGGQGAGGGSSGAQPKRAPITLACGHTFCDPCLTRWLQQKSTCPICRVKVTDSANVDDSHGIPNLHSSAAAEAAAQANRAVPDLWAMELAFRLGSLHRMYPGYVSPSMADQWAAEARQTGTFNWEASRDFQLRDPGMRVHHEQHGSGGFSTSFGGGSSYGGGGGGGSW